MIGDELRVEQAIAAGLEPRDQMHQRDLGGIARAVKHAFAEERAAERHAVKPADQLVAVIDLDGVAMAALDTARGRCVRMRALIQVRARSGLGSAQPSITASKSRSTRTVKGVARTVRASRAGTWNPSSGMMPRMLRLDPVERRIVGAFGHRERCRRHRP